MANKRDAVISLLRGKGQFSFSVDLDKNEIKRITCFDGQAKPTDEEIEAEEKRLQDIEDAK